MAVNLQPPSFPLRPSDSSSRFLAKDLALAYPLLDRGDVVRNYGFWGAGCDLTISGASYSRSDGLATLDINTGQVISRNGVGRTIPTSWSYAFWVKIDAAPTLESLDILTFQGPTEAHLRAWIDQQGIWAWQKHATADAYSILPASDYPTSNLMLVIAVFTVSYIPPAQLRTNQGFSTKPIQPFSYTAFNDAQGAPATSINSIFIGNNNSDSAPLKGSLGPLYFWTRVISESEIWQLWQDPYAPFRRSTEQIVVPSSMVSSSNFSLEGLGKSTDLQPLFQDDGSLTIFINDFIDYAAVPNDYVVNPDSGNLPAVNISISDSYTYQAIPADTIDAPGSSTLQNIEIEVIDSASYVALPSDNLEGDAPFSLITINIDENHSYVAEPADSFIPAESTTVTSDVITITDTYDYQDLPAETVTSP